MERRRFNEEIDVVKKEMGNYLHYYKDIVIPNIEKELKSFTSQFLNGMLMSNLSMTRQEEISKKYI